MTRPGVDRDELETDRVLHCHFCASWSMHVTPLDRRGDVADAYSLHLVRHGDAVEIALLDTSIWNAIVRELEG
ncbi:MAG: hypothetical protein JWN17_2803 [Frankiales bacterium]|nr:hypothetical protein [Frankiales bacterium]